jgi:hypothetical protein
MKDSFYEELERVLDQFPKCYMNILLRNFSVNVVREDIFKPTAWNDSLHKINNGIRVVDFATSNNLIVKSTIFPRNNS